MKKQYTQFLILLFTIGLILLSQFSGIKDLISFDSLKQHRAYLLNLVETNYIIAALLYIIMYIVVTAFSIPIAAPLTIMSGFLFGVIPGVIYTNIGATIGATCTFLIFRHLIGNRVQATYKNKLASFNENIKFYGSNYLILARLIVIIPFFLVNILSAFTKIPLTTFIWTTSLGIIPATIVYAYAGKQLGSLETVQEIFSAKIIVAFSLLIMLGLLSLIIKRYLYRKNKNRETTYDA